ncbi:MAG TPA: hypothetical protein VND45_17425 [Thermoanaerobaculia bacterium]|jgi:hypothetical protein|nr:hypothetical protein [Thermoanaerobaculia bacterium]
MPKEPQSYGSGSDWVTGNTGQEVNEQKSEPAPEHRDFYDERRESETSSPVQGGQTSDFQLAENAESTEQPTGEESPVAKVTTADTGAKRDSFFKKRDYE